MSARDKEPSRALATKTARLKRAFENHMEWLLLFAIAVGVIEMSGQNSGFTEAFAWIYLSARVLYVPAYLMALRPGRSAIWAVGFFATTLMLLAALI